MLEQEDVDFMQRLITEVLNIKYPIIQGGMAWISEAELAAAVSNAGGAGIISSGGRTVEFVREQIRKAKSLTDKPFGVNMMLMAPNKDEIFEVICEEKPDFVTLGAGNPVPYFDKLHAAGIKAVPVIPNVKLAKRVAAAGADALVAEGMEAGGHIGVLTTMALMEQVIPAVDIPVVMAGGFVDGRGIAAALLMGAGGVQLGTRFLIAEECKVHPNVKERLLQAVDTDTIVTGYTLGAAVRGLKNKFSIDFVEKENTGAATKDELIKMATGTNKLAAVEGDVEHGMVQAGQSLLPLNKIEPAKDIIETLIIETKAALNKAQNINI
ncbi:nitronate monooxygenase [Pectinatus brassicae]|nr:nitronate monooxygenase [Pectinatus brassicae]